jgi:DNA-binding transcriptional LysR family regulator
MSPPNPLDRIRSDPFVHWIALVVALLVGLVLARLHWVGLVAGGALVGLVATTLKRAVLAGFGFGVTVLTAWVASLALNGVLSKVLATGQFVWIAVAVGLLAPLLGSLSRGVI